jgi:hypothetical protein
VADAGKAGAVLAGVDDGDHVHAGAVEVAGGLEAVLVVDEQRDAAARGHAPAVEVGAHGAGEHDARAVVVAERDGRSRAPAARTARWA